MVKHAPWLKLLKWHLPFVFWGGVFATVISVMYLKWYDLKPLKGLEANSYIRLMEGNKRFSSGHPRHPDESVEHRRKIAASQNPFAVIVTCSDSRVSPELIFDQGLGDLFVIRTAGNLLSDMEMGSIEYAVEHLRVNTVVVMGHEACGAIKALMSNQPFQGHIKTIIDSLQLEPEIQQALESQNLEQAIKANVVHQVRALRTNLQKTITHAENRAPVMVTGFLYSLESGRVIPLDYFESRLQAGVSLPH